MGRSKKKRESIDEGQVSKNTLKQRKRREKLYHEGGDKLAKQREIDRLRKQAARKAVRKQAKKIDGTAKCTTREEKH